MTISMIRELEETKSMIVSTAADLESQGKALAQAEAEYQKTKAIRALQLQKDGQSATMIQMVIKGDPEVNNLLFARDCAKAVYDSAKEQLQALKLSARLLAADIDREYSEAVKTS